MRDVAVIGGGASGLVAAISAAEAGDNVVVFEAADRVGKKILATGNGRCNLTNMLLGAADYNHPAFVEPSLSQCSPAGVRVWFEERGLMTVEEREGRVYPLSNAANSVLDVLRLACERLGVELRTEAKVKAVTGDDGGIELVFEDGGISHPDKVIVACGGGSKLLKSCGHKLVSFQPVLCPIETDTRDLRGMSGVRVRARVKLEGAGAKGALFEEDGELLFRDYGVSGIVAFNASRFLDEGQVLRVDFVPEIEEARLKEMLESRAGWARDCAELMCGIFHPQVNRMIMRVAGIKPSSKADEAGLARIACISKRFKLAVKGPGSPKQAQVTRGGADVREFDPQTLESKFVPGLYACGECLDVDGPCGGYNLHWAWASGIVAGKA